MKRMLVIGGLVAAAVLAPATAAHANHLCVTSNGQNVVCSPHLESWFEQICVTSGGSPVICLF